MGAHGMSAARSSRFFSKAPADAIVLPFLGVGFPMGDDEAVRVMHSRHVTFPVSGGIAETGLVIAKTAWMQRRRPVGASHPRASDEGSRSPDGSKKT